MYKKWTNEDYEYLKQNYPYQDVSLIAKKFQCSERAVLHQVNNLRIKKHKTYKINHTFFDTWSSEMAYILGFIITDGCISDNNRLSFGVSIKDKYILDYISYKLTENKLVTIHNEIMRNKHHLIARLKFTSKYMANKLKDFYVVPRKTGKEILPQCPDEFKGDLLRGIFDGDGCVHISNKTYKYLRVFICSASQSFLETIKVNLGMNMGHINKATNIYRWNINKKDDIIKIRNLMYINKGFCLERKKIKFYG